MCGLRNHDSTHNLLPEYSGPDLAVALARKQIQVDSATDQALVRNFAGKLSSGSGRKDRQ